MTEKKNPTEHPLSQSKGLADDLLRFLKGIIIGIGAILPGLSGGVLAVIFGFYDPLMRFLANLRRRFWQQALFFLPLVLGLGTGIWLFSVVVEAAFGRYKALFTCLFVGFVLGTLPHLWRQASQGGRKRSHLLASLLAALVVLLIMWRGSYTFVAVEPSLPIWLLAGALMGLGIIVPGLSPSNFLIYFDLYDKMATGIKLVDLGVILPALLGLVVCVLLLARVVNWLIEKSRSLVYHVIFGTVVGSSLGVFPAVVWPALQGEELAAMQLGLPLALFYALLLLVLGTGLSYAFSILERRTDAQPVSDLVEREEP